MTRDYYILWYRLNGADRYLLWYTGDDDGMVVIADNKVPSFSNAAHLRRFATERNITIMDEQPILHDLDLIKQWLGNKSATIVDCDDLLAAWNLFDDVSRSTLGHFDSDKKLTNQLYDKLFLGNNLLPLNPGQHHYVPTWSEGEIKLLRKIMNSGMTLFRHVISEQ